MPYQLQLAHGLVSLPFKINLISVILLVPVIILAAQKYGAAGAAWAWILLNIGYVSIGVHFMFKKLLTTEKRSWYFDDLIYPIAVGFLCAKVLTEISKEVLPGNFIEHSLLSVATFSITFVLILLSCLSSASHLRRAITQKINVVR